MPTETQHLEQRVAALHSDLNTKDEQIDALTFSDNDRELSRRSWFDEAERLANEVEALRRALPNSTVEIVDLRAKLAERDAQLGACIAALREAGDYRSVASIEAALSASAEPKCQDGGMCADSSHKCTGCAPVERDLDDDPFFVQQAEPNTPAPVERDERADFLAGLLRRWLSRHAYGAGTDSMVIAETIAAVGVPSPKTAEGASYE